MPPISTNLALLTTRRITVGILAAAAVGVGGVSLHLADATAATQQSTSGVAGAQSSGGDDDYSQDGAQSDSSPDGSTGFAPVQGPQGRQAQGQAQGQQGQSGSLGGGAGTTTHGS